MTGGTGTVKKLMCNFMCDEKGNIIIDFIGRYENLDADFEKACKAIGIKNKLPHLINQIMITIGNTILMNHRK